MDEGSLASQNVIDCWFKISKIFPDHSKNLNMPVSRFAEASLSPIFQGDLNSRDGEIRTLDHPSQFTR
jgi:hypothetical protein